MSDVYRQVCKQIQNPLAGALGRAIQPSEKVRRPALIAIAVGASAAPLSRAMRDNPTVVLMRSMALVLSVLAGWLVSEHPVHAQTCKVCAEQRAACMKNYAGPACKTEYKMCLKACKK